MKLWKRNAIAAAIVLFVCGAVYLNWSYSQDTAAGKTLGEAALVGSQQDPLTAPQKEEEATGTEPEHDPAARQRARVRRGRRPPPTATSPLPASTASRPGTTPCPCSRRRQGTKKPTRKPWTRPTPPSRPWPTPP